MTLRFDAKLQAAQSEWLLYLRPQLTKMPLPIQRYDDPFLPFGKAIINATRDLVCGYMFDFAAYLTLGAAGAVALERTIAYAGADGETITILHAPFWGGAFARATGENAFNVDAVTLIDNADSSEYAAEGVATIPTADDSFDAGTLTYGSYNLRLMGDSVVYAGRGDDFADRVREAVHERK